MVVRVSKVFLLTNNQIMSEQLIDLIDLINMAEGQDEYFRFEIPFFRAPISFSAYITLKDDPQCSLTKTNMIRS